MFHTIINDNNNNDNDKLLSDEGVLGVIYAELIFFIQPRKREAPTSNRLFCWVVNVRRGLFLAEKHGPA